MANQEHLQVILQQGVEAWNAWRFQLWQLPPPHRNGVWDICADLTEAPLAGADLRGAFLMPVLLSRADLRRADLTGALLRGDLTGAELTGANLTEADLTGVDLAGANLTEANLTRADLRGVNFTGANLTGANLTGANLRMVNLAEANLRGVNLRRVDLTGTDLRGVNLSEINLTEANLTRVDLTEADLTGTNLTGADLCESTLVRANLEGANLIGCQVYGIAAWNVNLVGAQQSDLVITAKGEPVITVDNLEVAQFIYLLLHKEKIREIIDMITAKAVLILGRFTPERKAVLDALREELRHRNYLPIVFDFDKPRSKDMTGTVETLARMARFIIADLTDPSSIPHELATIVPFLRTTPVLPLRLVGSGGYSMFDDLMSYTWVLDIHEYQDSASLVASLAEVIAPANAMVEKLRK